MRRFFLLITPLALMLGFGVPLRASKPPMNELLVDLDTRRVSAEEALLQHLDHTECDGSLSQAKCKEEAHQCRLELAAALKEMRWAAYDEVVVRTAVAVPAIATAPPTPRTPAGSPPKCWILTCASA